jgi:hypothetical protein
MARKWCLPGFIRDCDHGALTYQKLLYKAEISHTLAGGHVQLTFDLGDGMKDQKHARKSLCVIYGSL